MDHLNALYQYAAPALLLLNVWFLRQALAFGRDILRRNQEEHERFSRLFQAHDRRLIRLEAARRRDWSQDPDENERELYGDQTS